MTIKTPPKAFEAALGQYVAQSGSGDNIRYMLIEEETKTDLRDAMVNINFTLRHEMGYSLINESAGVMRNLQALGFSCAPGKSEPLKDHGPTALETQEISVSIPYTEEAFKKLCGAIEDSLVASGQSSADSTIAHVRGMVGHNRRHAADFADSVNERFAEFGCGDVIDRARIEAASAQAFSVFDDFMKATQPAAAPAPAASSVAHKGKGIVTLDAPDKGLNSGAVLG